jgi:hypothetical protein
MHKTGIIGTGLLAIWMILFVPLVTGFHHHRVDPTGPARPALTDPAAPNPVGAGYLPCDICARLAIPAVMTPAASVTPLSIRPDITFTDNWFRHPSLLHSPILGRAPPFAIV